ncbi:SPOR domain-containing protein [Marinobacter nanhaiticus D15-8W]|uniref:SPOR domain-containing protein n=1 Tax=Marinobacter nanhaiticus D15-8W TaxID=626887 RepID=N6WUR5_9GAMM|nr:SPOR domain-containing protein [Marinobacter nanhaiticus]ENO12598.2 SPOR domain-containing protein [Marinobacter nanhaiticus D15-8W]BES69936.1 SPOR domain-containing protein [Marinobacter nanhaiticus D15-8W]
MSRDYAKKPRNDRSAATSRTVSKNRPRPGARSNGAPKRQAGGLSLRWILSLAMVGGFIGFIAYLNSLPTPEEQHAAAPKPAPSKPSPAPAEKKKEQQQSFQFYDMLPESEVVPPKVKEYDPGPTAAERQYRYLVQTGSFKGHADAERQRAQIAFQGLRANIEKVTLDSGTTWYRVNVGPFDSRSKMNSAVDKLVGINIQPLVRKVPKG